MWQPYVVICGQTALRFRMVMLFSSLSKRNLRYSGAVKRLSTNKIEHAFASLRHMPESRVGPIKTRNCNIIWSKISLRLTPTAKRESTTKRVWARQPIRRRRNQCDVYKFYEPPTNKMNNKSRNYRTQQIPSEIRDEFLKAASVASISHEMWKKQDGREAGKYRFFL